MASNKSIEPVAEMPTRITELLPEPALALDRFEQHIQDDRLPLREVGRSELALPEMVLAAETLQAGRYRPFAPEENKLVRLAESEVIAATEPAETDQAFTVSAVQAPAAAGQQLINNDTGHETDLKSGMSDSVFAHESAAAADELFSYDDSPVEHKSIAELNEKEVPNASAEVIEEPAEPLAPAAAAALAHIAELLPIETKQIEQVEAFVTATTEEVQEALTVYLTEAAPEEAEQVSQLAVMIAAAADRLNVLMELEDIPGEEAVQIEALLREWYRELLVTIQVEPKPELIEEFIAAIKAESYRRDFQRVMDEEILDERKLENKYGLLGLAHGLSDSWRQRIGGMIGRVMLSESLS